MASNAEDNLTKETSTREITTEKPIEESKGSSSSSVHGENQGIQKEQVNFLDFVQSCEPFLS